MDISNFAYFGIHIQKKNKFKNITITNLFKYNFSQHERIIKKIYTSFLENFDEIIPLFISREI